jgi:hypothetical protein
VMLRWAQAGLNRQLAPARSPLPAAVDCRGIGRVASAKNGQVTLLRQASGIDSKGRCR